MNAEMVSRFFYLIKTMFYLLKNTASIDLSGCAFLELGVTLKGEFEGFYDFEGIPAESFNRTSTCWGRL